ncbi:MAG: methyltransferase domain-containing protein [Acidimicrobiia bacterium]|nr:methyltransferase domain-containing protein [Acidimicrobiia bacterium]
MVRPRSFVILLGAVAAVSVVRHGVGIARRKTVPGGILIGDAVGYDKMSRIVLGSFFRPVAADVASIAPDGAGVLEVGCGPGHLSIELARRHGLDMTGLDLDPAMIERARANADRAGNGSEHAPSFSVGDASSLPYPDGSFDVVVSTLSMHHWDDATAGLAEIERVLRPDGRAVVWDFRSGVWPFHTHLPDPVEATHGSPLGMVSATPWPWPWKLNLVQRIEMTSADRSSGNSRSVPG